MKKIAVFASGSGTNFQAIMDAIKVGALEAQWKRLYPACALLIQLTSPLRRRQHRDGRPEIYARAVSSAGRAADS